MKRNSVLAGLLVAVFALALSIGGAAQEQKKEGKHKSKFAEVEKFHELLAPIWHEQYPAKEWSKIRAQGDELVKRKDDVMNIRLRVKSDAQARVEELRKKFGESVDSLAKIARSGSDDELQKSVAAMHEAFENFADAIR